jgi:ubiquinone/menaquinone biosynthesis C-methylase UbiE
METVSDVGSDYDKVAGDYDKLFLSPECTIENAAAFSRVRGMLNGDTIVDLGCGTGLLLEGVPEIGPRGYLGIDVSAGMLERARTKFKDYTFKQGCMTETGIETGSVSCVVSLFSAVNYVELEPLIIELERILEPGGTFLLVFRRYLKRKSEEVPGIPVVPFIHGENETACELLARDFEDLRINGLTGPLWHDLFMVVQGRRSA